MSDYVISKRAIADLDEIWVYTASTWSESKADKYYEQLRTAIRNLHDLPEFLSQGYDSIKEGLCGYKVGHHIIFFKRNSDGTIYVERILHERMDYPQHL